MKKIISAILITGVLLTGTPVFAARTAVNSIKTRVVNKLQDWRAKVSEAKPLIDRVRINTGKINSLNADVNKGYKAAKKRVEALLKKKEDLTQEQIEKLKEALIILKNDQKPLADSADEFKNANSRLDDAKRNKDINLYKQSLRNVIAIQNIRIEKLKKVIGDMKQITEI